jgi:hypothetical protein
MKPPVAQKIWIVGIILTVMGCTTTPLDRKFTQKQLVNLLRHRPLCEARLTEGSEYTPNYAKCDAEWRTHREKLEAAYSIRHSREMAAAPACLAEWKVDPETLQLFGIATETPNGAAELISKGVFSTADLSPQCIADVCEWQGRMEPDRSSKIWCHVSAGRTALPKRADDPTT